MVNHRVSDKDQATFDKLLALHSKFPELISPFKDELDAFDNFVVTVSKLHHFHCIYALNSCPDGFKYAWCTLLKLKHYKIQYHWVDTSGSKERKHSATDCQVQEGQLWVVSWHHCPGTYPLESPWWVPSWSNVSFVLLMCTPPFLDCYIGCFVTRSRMAPLGLVLTTFQPSYIQMGVCTMLRTRRLASFMATSSYKWEYKLSNPITMYLTSVTGPACNLYWQVVSIGWLSFSFKVISGWNSWHQGGFVMPSNILRYNQAYKFIGSRFQVKCQSSPKSLSKHWEPMF